MGFAFHSPFDMSTIVGIMDRAGFEANTDILVLVQPVCTRLLWVPRDLWCEGLHDRINTAFAAGRHSRLVSALAEHDLEAQHSLIISREATEATLSHVKVVVPVPARMTFAYPLSPTTPIELGSKEVAFNPPAELLHGERIHQWIGARGGSDLHRIERQKVLLRRLMDTRFDFSSVLSTPAWFLCSDDGAFSDLRQIDSTWRFETLAGLRPATIDGKQVLMRDH
jgi:hypothetical protein